MTTLGVGVRGRGCPTCTAAVHRAATDPAARRQRAATNIILATPLCRVRRHLTQGLCVAPGIGATSRPAKPAERHRHRRIGLTEHRCRNRSVVHRRDTGSTPVRGVAAPTAPGAPATAPATPGASHSCTTGTCASSGAVAHTRAPPNRSVVLPTNVPSRSGLALRFRPSPTSRPDAEAPEFGPGNRWTHRRRD